MSQRNGGGVQSNTASDGRGQRVNYGTTVLFQLRCQRIRGLDAMLEDDKDFDALAFYLVWRADGCLFCHFRLAHEAGFNFHRPKAVAADFDNLVHTALNAEV